MSNSTTNLDLISASQANKEVTANSLFDAASPAMLYGRRAVTTAGLTWGYFGGTASVAGAPTAIANGVVTLTASATNFVEANPTTGAVSVNTTGFTAGYKQLYSIVTGAGTVTSYTDLRTLGGGDAGGVTSINGQDGDVTLAAADVGADVAGTAAAAVAAHTSASDPHGQYALESTIGVAGGIASLGGDGKLNSDQLPDLAVIDHLGTVASQAAMLALTGQKGDWAIRSDEGKVYVITGSSPSNIGSWTPLSYPTGAGGTVTSVAASVPSFLQVSGSPITTTGTLAISYSGTALPIANGGTGATSATAALNALLPSQTGNGTKVLTTDGTNASWATASGGGGSSITGTAGAQGGDATVTGGASSTSANPGGQTIIMGGAAGATGVGGATTIKGGPGGSTSGVGGAVNILAGTSTSSDGASVNITAASVSGTVFTNGGSVNITAGNARAGGNGGDISLTSGTQAGTNNGAITLQGGNGGYYTTGAKIQINGQATGWVTIQGAGGKLAGADAGGVQVIGGDGGGSNNLGGVVNIKGGTGGNATNSNPGGAVNITGGSPANLAGAIGGPVNITGGAGAVTGTGAAGQPVNIVGGAAGGSGNNAGGNVVLKAGAATGTGAAGNVILNGTGSALATAATGGFTCLPTCAGTPTGVPANVPTGCVAMVMDTVNFKLYVYMGGWKAVTLA